MLGASFPPSALGVLACFALVPLLILLADVPETGTGLRYTYLAMLVFHLITLNWTGGYAHMKDPYMMIAGAVTMTVHPLFYFIPVGLYLYIRKRAGAVTALVALPFLWTGYEYTHALSEWSFPWLTLGNSQSYDLARIQIADVTGVYGLSLWILILNVLAFALYSVLAAGWSGRRIPRAAWGWTAAIVLVFFLPWVYGTAVLSGATIDGAHPAMDRGTVTVGMIQSNTDPWEKWTESGTSLIMRYFRLTGRLVDSARGPRPDIVLWPETAMPYFILAPQNRSLLGEIRARVADLNVSLLTGLPQIIEYPEGTKAPAGAKRLKGSTERYDAFNAAAFIQPGVDRSPGTGR